MIDLYPFQDKGASWLANKGIAILADEMRLGKSAQAIRACDLVNAEAVLVVCPATARDNWRREFQKFSVTSIFPEVISYEQLTRSFDWKQEPPRSAYTQLRWDVLICDESHFLKEPKSKRTHAVFGMGGVARSSNRVWCLSGTPAPNHVAELWVLLHVTGRTALAYESFVDQYCNSYEIENRRQITGTKTNMVSQVRSMLNPIMLRRTKAEVLPELPPMHYGELFVEEVNISFPENLREDLDYEREKLSRLLDLHTRKSNSDKELMDILEVMAQSVSTLRRYMGLQKAIGACLQISQELEEKVYEKVVIFAIHTQVIDIVRQAFPQAAVIVGATPAKLRQGEIDRFNRDPKCNVFIGNIKAAGTAINLSAADHIVFIEQDWVPGNNAQAAERCNNMQRLDSVYVRFTTLADNPLDEKITQVLKRKSAELSMIFDA